MEEKLNLYQVFTFGLGSFYVVAHDFTEASERVKKLLDEANYGLSGDRSVTSVGLLTSEMSMFAMKPSFTNKDARLILPTSCKTTKDEEDLKARIKELESKGE